MTDNTSMTLERVPSGILGLDAILGGGFFRGGVYLFLAKPGAGKTILGNQMCFRHVAAGGRAVFVTLLTESHARLIAQLRTLDFFDPECVGASLQYVSAYEALEKDKLHGLLILLRRVVRDHKATLLVLDGVVTAGAMAESEIETKKFVHELQVFVELVGCTTMLLTGATDVGEQYALRTMVDGLVELRLAPAGMDAVRTIEIAKFRGGAVHAGRHLFDITNAGLTIYPRTECLRGRSLDRPDLSKVAPAMFGVDGLDSMLLGGLRAGTLTMLLGSPGSGKTHLGLRWLATGAKTNDPSLYFGFYESPEDLNRKAEAIGIPLGDHIKSGRIRVVWPLDTIVDALAENVLGCIRRHGVKRLFIDGVGGFQESLEYGNRSKRFFTAFFNELRALGVTTMLSDETRNLVNLHGPEHGLTPLLDNVIFLRHVELRAQLHRVVSVMKTRDGTGDASMREFSIGARGFVVASDSKSAEAALSGLSIGEARRPDKRKTERADRKKRRRR